MRFSRFGAAIRSVALVSVASCVVAGGGGGAASDLQSSLAGHPDATTEAAAQTLVPILDAADWFYLTNATWPSDLPTVLADQRLQKAMTPFIGTPVMGIRRRAQERLLDTSGSPPQIQTYLNAARQAMIQANGTATAGTPASAAAFAQGMGQRVTPPLPAAGSAADTATDVTTVTFFKTGGSSVSHTITPPCCNGEIVFPGGQLTCFDSTSCKGKGEPPAGGITVTGSTSSSGGTGGSGSGAGSGGTGSGGSSSGTGGGSGGSSGAGAPTCASAVSAALGLSGNCFYPSYSACSGAGYDLYAGSWTAATSMGVVAQLTGGTAPTVITYSGDREPDDITIDASTCTVTWVHHDSNSYVSGFTGANCTATGVLDPSTGQFTSCTLVCPANSPCGTKGASGTSSVGGCGFSFYTCY